MPKYSGFIDITPEMDLHGRNVLGVAERVVKKNGSVFYRIAAELDFRDPQPRHPDRGCMPYLTNEPSRRAPGRTTHTTEYSKGDGGRILSRAKTRSVGPSKWEFAVKADLAREFLGPTDAIDLLHADIGPRTDGSTNLRIVPESCEKSDFRLDKRTMDEQHNLMNEERRRVMADRAREDAERQAQADAKQFHSQCAGQSGYVPIPGNGIGSIRLAGVSQDSKRDWSKSKAMSASKAAKADAKAVSTKQDGGKPKPKTPAARDSRDVSVPGLSPDDLNDGYSFGS